MKTIQVLMSTYNGEKYIREQLDSILAQDCEQLGLAKVHVLIRDDGSSDKTTEILKQYNQQYPQKIAWYQGGNKGVIKSFFDALMQSSDEADYYAFADQDDSWMADKLSSGIRQLDAAGDKDKPNLYCGKPRLTDGQLRDLDSQIKRPPMRPSFANALIENVVMGATIVMNPVLRNMVRNDIPEYTTMHDWWFYLVASCFGNVIYDETPHIRYRQHGANEVGQNASYRAELVARLRRFKGNRGKISRQLEEFLRIYGARGGENIRLAQELLESRSSFRKRWKLVRRKQIYRQRKNDDRIFRLILLSGSF